MKHLNLWESYQDVNRVAKICEQYFILNWSLNSQGLVDVDGDVNLSSKGLTKLPLYFGELNDFFCTDNKLTTLEGVPRKVNGTFDCDGNQLETLEGGPQIVLGSYFCNHNKLTRLDGAPNEVEGGFLLSL